MKKWCLFIVSLLLLTGCRSMPFEQHSVIDWVDFIKLDGQTYDGVYSGVLADQNLVNKMIGTVQFKVADNVTNPNYKIKNGDAAFHEKGTQIFNIKGHPNLIAVKSKSSINGYQVYYSRDKIDYKWHFKDMPTEKVKKIEVYQAYTSEGNKLISEITQVEEVKSLLHLLVSSEVNSTFEPNTEKGDPTYYEMIFYTEDPIAFKFGIQFDGATYFWHPWDTAILSNDIQRFTDQE
ncbi:hypothetical protein ACTHO0_26235 [Cytobacillus praedii]|uniref:hypothetical protein n=1 Tax=Cytobacillus praedii TaxID=1742358 RepID=UPI002E1AF485|nr:hypothetical protein [Cytobacillus praedii]